MDYRAYAIIIQASGIRDNVSAKDIYRDHIGSIGIMENQMDNEMETRVTLGFGGFRKTGDPSGPCNQDDSFLGGLH